MEFRLAPDHLALVADDGAYPYLTPGTDYPGFELAPEFGRVPAYVGDLTPEQEERARRLLRDSLVISLHDHPVRFPLRMDEALQYLGHEL